MKKFYALLVFLLALSFSSIAQGQSEVKAKLRHYESLQSKSKTHHGFYMRAALGATFGKINFEEKSSVTYQSLSGNIKGAECRYTLDGSTPDETSQLYLKPFIADSSCTLSARCFKKGLLPGNTVIEKLKVFSWKPSEKVVNTKQGLNYAAYQLNPKTTDDLKNITPIKTGIKSTVSISDSIRSENMGLSYEGYFNAPADAVYTFYLMSDDGSKLWLDNEVLIDNDGLHGDVELKAGVALKKGVHPFKLAFIQAGGGATLELQYSVSGQNKKPVPASLFFHNE